MKTRAHARAHMNTLLERPSRTDPDDDDVADVTSFSALLDAVEIKHDDVVDVTSFSSSAEK